jgi:DNA-binding LytR/AlgR family response regulator
MKCTVIDDEPYALDLMRGYVAKTPFLELTECFSNPFKALSFLTSTRVDLIFLDINMPEVTGIQLIKSLPTPPKVIFTTAYPEFAAESYEYNAIDYLLKPVRYERFLKAVNKAAEFLNQNGLSLPAAEVADERLADIVIKSGTRFIKIDPNEILYVEGAGNYMIFHTAGQKIMALLTMQEVIESLPADLFIRIHKSFIVSLKHIDMIENHDVRIHGIDLPIGNTYQEQFLKRIGNKDKNEKIFKFPG